MNAYFCNCFCNPTEFYNKYIKDLFTQYPNTKLKPTLDFNSADIISVCNYVGKQTLIDYNALDKKKIIQFQYEPPTTCRTWGKWNDKNIMDNEIKKFFDIERNRSVTQPYYDVKSQAYRPCNLTTTKRTDKMCAIQSLWNTLPNHLIRNKFLDFLQEQEYSYHLFGGTQYTMINKTIDMYPQFVGTCDNKYDILSRYKYSLVIENTSENNWFSEKIWDCFIAECLPFYYGCPNLEKFFPAESFMRLPLQDFGKSLQIIENAIMTNEYEKRLPAIKESKRLCLEKYDIINTLESLI